MGKWAAESTGLSVLRPIAAQILKNDKKKCRVWSENLNAWGFFHEIKNDEDSFLVWCSIVPGDRMYFQQPNEGVHTLIAVWKQKDMERPAWTFKFLNSNGNLLDVHIDETTLFKSGWINLF